MSYVYFILFVFILSLLILNYNFDLNIKPGTINSICQNEKENRLEEKGKLSDKLQVKSYLRENFPEIKFSKVIYELDNARIIRTPSCKNLDHPNSGLIKDIKLNKKNCDWKTYNYKML